MLDPDVVVVEVEPDVVVVEPDVWVTDPVVVEVEPVVVVVDPLVVVVPVVEPVEPDVTTDPVTGGLVVALNPPTGSHVIKMLLLSTKESVKAACVTFVIDT